MFEYMELAMSIVKLDANMLLPNQPMKFPRKKPTNISPPKVVSKIIFVPFTKVGCVSFWGR